MAQHDYGQCQDRQHKHASCLSGVHHHRRGSLSQRFGRRGDCSFRPKPEHGLDELPTVIDEPDPDGWLRRRSGHTIAGMTAEQNDTGPGNTLTAGWSSARFAFAAAAGAWLLDLSLIGLRLLEFGYPHYRSLMERHLVTTIGGMALTGVLYFVLRRIEPRSFGVRITAAILLAAPAAILVSLLSYNALFVFGSSPFRNDDDPAPGLLGQIAFTILENYFVFLSWTIVYTAFSSAIETQRALRRAALSESYARVAELRALRFQLDPHFLFNALNTVSALVVTGDAKGADRAIDALSRFLRATLSSDTSGDITLADEIELQALYLEIEKTRFGKRLFVEISLPEGLSGALVPALLLQPLVENSIRHGVAKTSTPVHVRVSAWRADDRLHLAVEDDATGPATDAGHGVGLRNVATRLTLRFGAAGTCEYGVRRGGGFRTEIAMPFSSTGAVGAARV
ncbi:histidine kinase [Lichenicola cladoniae]|uniref:Histidine kinase n=1 Tax=Lichenicola cladoniae TaxID=1484109 RepID=A0A6M8HT61_9PROT|nr:histidine kinase [Lichenicola cladoniae]NPD67788.1 histidine kinase [Acetobacteraceae bacterium]QKE91709.1 histidine kinase [Lichenicola cladoniae]